MSKPIPFPDRIGALARLDDLYAQEDAAAQAFYRARDMKAPVRAAAGERWAAAMTAVAIARRAVPISVRTSRLTPLHQGR